MGYYIATISVSVSASSDEESVIKIEQIRKHIEANRNCNPYIEQVKELNQKPTFLNRYRHVYFYKIIKSVISKKNIK